MQDQRSSPYSLASKEPASLYGNLQESFTIYFFSSVYVRSKNLESTEHNAKVYNFYEFIIIYKASYNPCRRCANKY